MSWFDAGALANIAKSALKEAQKTIDKALDIKDEVNAIAPLNTPVDTDDFFGTWGITPLENVSNSKDESPDENGKQKLANSFWGSFTGSFFDNNKDDNSIEKSIEERSHNDLATGELVQNNEPDTKTQNDDVANNDQLVEVDLGDSTSNCTNSSNQNILLTKKSDKTSSSYLNRLSIISTESGKNSSESVDIITCSTECTTTPESDILSLGLSASTCSSAGGIKQASESVEILGDSLTSPSSVEIIDSESSSSRRVSQPTDEFVSPFESPSIETKLSLPNDKVSPDSVEVIPEDQDENSIAEDTMSYTSVSESTSATVLDSVFNLHSKPQKMLKDTYNRPELYDSIASDNSNLSPDKVFNIAEAITRAPARSSMHLPLTQVSQVLIDTQPQSINKQELPKILEKTNIIDIPQDEELGKSSGSENLMDVSTDDGSQSDKTLMDTQDNLMESSSDTTSTTTDVSSTSTYLKKMIADAMVEKSSDKDDMIELEDKASSIGSIAASQIELIPRETSSPLSSEKSDLVKVGSDHTSCHTSCDELETTTSSDIEIISSPNGDSSSTQSRQSPAKQTISKPKSEDNTVESLLHKMTIKKVKGHNRELSEASSISDDSHANSEVDRLIKRISEMTEILESRESKLIDLTRRNVELQEHNSGLKNQLDCVLTQQLESANLTQVTDEYTQRLSALEKKFQQAIREKDNLRKQLDQVKLDAATRMSKGELESTVAEKDLLIKELRQEGEKLSKQQLQHSNIIKKLRVKEKEHEAAIKHLKESNESLSLETDRLKKSLSAKEDVERTQIEAIHQLTNKNKKLENEVAKLKNQLDDLSQKYDTTKKSLDAAKKELIEKHRASSELIAREQLLQSLENEKKMTESQNEEVISQLDDLRYKLRKSEEEYAQKEQKLKHENSELLRRLEETEARAEELSQSVLEVSKPLVKQLESLQTVHSMKMTSFEKNEQELTLKIRDLKSKLQTSTNLERTTKEECLALREKMADVEGQLGEARHQLELTSIQLEQQKSEKHLAVQELKREIETIQDTTKKLTETIEGKTNEIERLQQELSLRKSLAELDKKAPSGQQNASNDRMEADRSSSNPDSNSPTLSLGKASVSESLSSSFWSQQDEPFEISHTPRYTNVFEMQMLQSNLKQREGEVQQLQWEMNRRDQERSILNSEIASLLTRVDNLESLETKYSVLKDQYKELQQQYDTLCQLYGEKVEENEELKLDLLDVKEMYKSQIDELLNQQK